MSGERVERRPRVSETWGMECNFPHTLDGFPCWYPQEEFHALWIRRLAAGEIRCEPIAELFLGQRVERACELLVKAQNKDQYTTLRIAPVKVRNDIRRGMKAVLDEFAPEVKPSEEMVERATRAAVDYARRRRLEDLTAPEREEWMHTIRAAIREVLR